MDADELAIVQEIELGSSGDNIPESKCEQAPNTQHEIFIIKKTTTKRCLFLSTGIIIGSIVSGILVFSVMKYSGISSYNVSSCFWTEWTEWTPCKSSLIVGKQRRVQIYTGLSKTCDLKERIETKSCYDLADVSFDRKLDIRFDPTTLCSTCFLSDDNTTRSNRYTDRTRYNPKAESRFQNYRGAMVNTCVENSTSIYYEIYFQYIINTTLLQRKLVLELGIAKRDEIDNHHYAGFRNVSGWSFHLAKCLDINKVCLYYHHKPHGIFTANEFSNNAAGTKINGIFGILIDRERNTFSLFYNKTILFTFNDVLSDVPLCPVFGVYSPYFAEVYLQIMSVGNMTSAF